MAADSKARFLHDAERFVLQGKVPQAIGEYLKIIKFDPNDVLILNTIGDLYLRQGNVIEANKCFSQVAESYVRDNFLSKAIAVYKKILSADPGNIGINLIVASLYSRQGISVDARNQYLRVAALYEKEGKAKESLDAYEKVAELDPANAEIQRKLAELYLAQGAEDKAHQYWIGAARAQAKAGNLSGAKDSFGRALQFNPINVQAMQGYFDCCLQMGNAAPALDLLEKSLSAAPDNLDLREMLGRGYLAIKNPEAAARALEMAVSMDSSRYQEFFALSHAFLDAELSDRAAECLDSIVPILITRRETERAVKMYEAILQRCPGQILTMTRLASIFSATDDRDRYLDALERISEYYLSKKCPAEAAEYLEKILKMNPESEKHRQLHRQAFSEAYPDVPYIAPAPAAEIDAESVPASLRGGMTVPGGESSSEIVEVDLLLNYGLREKALGILRGLETRDPSDKEVRVRLLAALKEEKRYDEAAEQCLLLAALNRKANNGEAALGYLAEARQLSPEVSSHEQELDDFARQNGIGFESTLSGSAGSDELKSGAEVDLSGDLLDMFFTGDESHEPYDVPEHQAIQDPMIEAYPQNLDPKSPAKPVQEQLQEVDFYIRLGFHDEALAKLNDIGRIYPEHPEILQRYRKLGETPPLVAQPPEEIPVPEAPVFTEPSEPIALGGSGIFQELESSDALDDFVQNHVGPAQTLQLPESEKPTDDINSWKRPEIWAKTEPETEKPAMEAFEASALSAGDFGEPLQTHYDASPAFATYNAPPEPVQYHDLPVSTQSHAPSAPARSDFKVNEMFADLLDEVSSLSDQDIAKEDFEEHFSLGTAYREMDLIEESIREFQSALKTLDLRKDAKKVVQCCGMLSTCFLKKGMPRSAVRWCQTGLSVADISSHEAMALRYDMGVAHSMAGSSEQALECFDRIFGMDPSYRDVAQRIDELRACP